MGTTISVFVKTELLSEIRNVEVSRKMTGLGGMVGNKGSVVIWLDFQLTSMAFIASHLAAGSVNAICF